ncbi:MAG: tripartite tricarboxylate transporter substrate binding protein [Burkholderiaceae bacterium]|nr:tripartite tricarboxylate transporter substrate binding protein [Burkholderiaceae bacterium]
MRAASPCAAPPAGDPDHGTEFRFHSPSQTRSRGDTVSMLRLLAAWALALACLPPLQAAEAFPARPVRWIVPFQPGGTTDIVARIVAERLAERWRQPVVVENRPGANAAIGTQAGARADPDGYTWTFAYNGNMTMNPALIAKLPYDPNADFVHVAKIVGSAFVLVVHPAVPARSLKEFIDLAKASPGKPNAAIGGGAGQLSMALFKSKVGIDVLDVSYKGNAPSLNAVLSGEAQVMFETVAAALPHLRAGKLRALAVTTPTRTPLLPDTPPIADLVPGFDVTLWFGLSVPAGTPPALVDRINAELTDIARGRESAEKFAALGLEPLGGSAAQTGAAIRAEAATWRRIAREANIPQQ